VVLSKRDRVEAALDGRKLDRIPVSAWEHLIPAEADDATFAKAQIAFFREFDWDWLKVNNRATLFTEAWGNAYDFSDYQGVLPRLSGSTLGAPVDISEISPVDVSTGVFGSYLGSLHTIVEGVGGAPVIQTVFSPLSVLQLLVARPAHHSQDETNQDGIDSLKRLIAEKPDLVHRALGAITKTIADFSAASLDAGTDGIFFAVTRLAREGVLSKKEFEEFGKPYDLTVLKAVEKAPFNVFHLCGPKTYFALSSEYPAPAVSWAAVGQGNPSVANARHYTDKALIGGSDETRTLRTGTPAEVAAEAAASIKASGGKKFLLAPGCAVEPGTPRANLHALRRATEVN
jgi:uroporphyrinogen decarboxylase